jgi:hypothetical protein
MVPPTPVFKPAPRADKAKPQPPSPPVAKTAPGTIKPLSRRILKKKRFYPERRAKEIGFALGVGMAGFMGAMSPVLLSGDLQFNYLLDPQFALGFHLTVSGFVSPRSGGGSPPDIELPLAMSFLLPVGKVGAFCIEMLAGPAFFTYYHGQPKEVVKAVFGLELGFKPRLGSHSLFRLGFRVDYRIPGTKTERHPNAITGTYYFHTALRIQFFIGIAKF